MAKDIEHILNYLAEQRGFDFSGYRLSLIERRLKQRLAATKTSDLSEYLSYLNQDIYPIIKYGYYDEVEDIYLLFRWK